jgi:hypothetical protein
MQPEVRVISMEEQVAVEGLLAMAKQAIAGALAEGGREALMELVVVVDTVVELQGHNWLPKEEALPPEVEEDLILLPRRPMP